MPSPTPRRRGHRLSQMPHAAEGPPQQAILGNAPSPVRLPEHALLIAVLWQAIMDATHSGQETREARAFLRTTVRLQWWCAWLDLDVDALQQGLKTRWPQIWGLRQSED